MNAPESFAPFLLLDGEKKLVFQISYFIRQPIDGSFFLYLTFEFCLIFMFLLLLMLSGLIPTNISFQVLYILWSPTVPLSPLFSASDL